MHPLGVHAQRLSRVFSCMVDLTYGGPRISVFIIDTCDRERFGESQE